MRRRLSNLRRICARALVLALAAGLVHGAATASAGTPYVDGISDQSLPTWDGSDSDSPFAGLFATAWVGQITLARYVLQWNAMAQDSHGPNPGGDPGRGFSIGLAGRRRDPPD